MFGRNLEDYIKIEREEKSFDDEFFDFTDKIYPWTTVYRYFFLTDLVKKTQLMLGIGQKTSNNYKVNGVKTEFSNTESPYKMAISYWVENGSLSHKTRNDKVNINHGIKSETFSFFKENDGYRFCLDDQSTDVFLKNRDSKTDFVNFKAGFSPFYRHNKYMPFEGKIKGKKVEKGFAYIQKVYLNMPFIPWRWGRVFFENGAKFDFYEPRMLVPLFKSINFEVEDRKLEFKHEQKINFSDSSWTLSGKTSGGESLKAKIRSYDNVIQTFETPRSTFKYCEMPSTLEQFEIKEGKEILYSVKNLGESVANCEVANYSKLFYR
jgi:hypothetical protein